VCIRSQLILCFISTPLHSFLLLLWWVFPDADGRRSGRGRQRRLSAGPAGKVCVSAGRCDHVVVKGWGRASILARARPGRTPVLWLRVKAGAEFFRTADCRGRGSRHARRSRASAPAGTSTCDQGYTLLVHVRSGQVARSLRVFWLPLLTFSWGADVRGAAAGVRRTAEPSRGICGRSTAIGAVCYSGRFVASPGRPRHADGSPRLPRPRAARATWTALRGRAWRVWASNSIR